MVDGKLFDTLAALATELRKKPDMPFGGIQVSIRPHNPSRYQMYFCPDSAYDTMFSIRFGRLTAELNSWS